MYRFNACRLIKNLFQHNVSPYNDIQDINGNFPIKQYCLENKTNKTTYIFPHEKYNIIKNHWSFIQTIKS